ncbi:TetR family transcriptional regulator [Pleomorphomonas diazotrophica]|uniref:TetR family transcriptional regulator n=1 Tax=Pleomorphomonas diazotrophica TaxID=1166257 RepID=A0A1I4TYZ9_9HYPH|nr:TetR/AcrR family transcriptional regulator [Pleomorphomonas diazotrophica]PKR87789.1 TetR family transcriptional regulator [Pleomorphomonas diazotrophica]SFM81984.1 DNA-binding transcriptional regulator, AcrR family [Pleomorphomonas diazotrophica]
MQERRTNRERSEGTTATLISTARRLFVERGYADTGTPDLVMAAGVTRGALYHHFADKRALFRAVVVVESRVIAEAVERAAPGGDDPVADLIAGGEAYLDAMAEPGRSRLLLVEAPAVLGTAEAAAIDAEHAGRTLREGIEAALAAGAIRPLPPAALVTLLGATYDRAALAIAEGAPRSDCTAVLAAMLDGLRT